MFSVRLRLLMICGINCMRSILLNLLVAGEISLCQSLSFPSVDGWWMLSRSSSQVMSLKSNTILTFLLSLSPSLFFVTSLAYDMIYTCKKCAEDCESCVDGSSCISSSNWSFRVSLFFIFILVITLILVVIYYIYPYWPDIRFFFFLHPFIVCFMTRMSSHKFQSQCNKVCNLWNRSTLVSKLLSHSSPPAKQCWSLSQCRQATDDKLFYSFGHQIKGTEWLPTLNPPHSIVAFAHCLVWEWEV